MALLAGAAVAFASSEVSVKRCGYMTLKFPGKVAIYPWHSSCVAAKKTLAGSHPRESQTKQFTADGAATDDGYAVRIAGKWWVCGGRMGTYFCGYPYRPARATRAQGGGTTFKGPFTKDIAFNECSAFRGACGSKSSVWLPGR